MRDTTFKLKLMSLIDLSPDKLDSEVSQPKECLSVHGIDPATITTFAVQHGIF